MDTAILVDFNKYSKTYKVGMATLYLAKAYDKPVGADKEMHYVVVSVPHFPDLNVSNIQLPIGFNSEEERDVFFESFIADNFVRLLRQRIITNQAKIKKEDDKIREN